MFGFARSGYLPEKENGRFILCGASAVTDLDSLKIKQKMSFTWVLVLFAIFRAGVSGLSTFLPVRRASSVPRAFPAINFAKFSRKAVLVKTFAKTEAQSKQDQKRRPQPAEIDAFKTPEEIILTMYNGRYNVTSWADHHPGGIAALRKYNHRNATQAYEKIGHSHHASALLESFRILENTTEVLEHATAIQPSTPKPSVYSILRSKLITNEDPFHVHKMLGIFCLLHFVYRYWLVASGWDLAAGLGSMGQAATGVDGRRRRHVVATTAVFLLPHALLSSSSLLFHTVPAERVRGKPMIWKEYRWHNMVFVLRSIVACFLATLCMMTTTTTGEDHAKRARVGIVAANSVACLATHVLADVATAKLRTNATESTITTVPFWEGCSPVTNKVLRTFYGYSQFAATMTCLMVCRYPSWFFLIIFPIQLASLLMTLCRKSIITSRQSHIGYTISLLMPLAVVIQNTLLDPRAAADLMAVVGGAAVLYGLRRKYRINKYALWIPTAVGRVAFAAFGM